MLQDKTDALGLCRGLAGPRVTGFGQCLKGRGYVGATQVTRVRAAAHLERWIQRSGLKLEETTEATLESFERHLPGCRCLGVEPLWRNGAMVCARLFLEYLRREGLVEPGSRTRRTPQPSPLVDSYRNWMLQHRGVQTRTPDQHGRVLDDLIHTLGDDPGRFRTCALRQFVLDRGRRCSRCQAQKIAIAVRAFLRFLVATGRCAAALEGAIPPVASYRLASLPRSLPASDIDRILGACPSNTPLGLRDRAILLLLCRLGLRAHEIAGLRLGDVDWREASVTVVSKGRRHDRLPFTQEIGD